MSISKLAPTAVTGKDGDWYWFRCGGYCVLSLTYQASNIACTSSNTGQYQSDVISTGKYLPSWVKTIGTVTGAAGQGSQGGGVRLHRVILDGVGSSYPVKFILACPQSSTVNFPFTVIVFGTC